MTQVIVDPREVKRFAAYLEATIHRMRDSKKNVAGSFNDLGTYWKDNQHSKFERDFQDMMGRLEIFFSKSEVHIDFLRQLAREGDGYSDIKF